MIPSNQFGGSRGGPPGSDSQPQSFGFYQASAFGQFSPQGNAFFGQPATPATTGAGGSQTTAFEQPLPRGAGSVFGQTAVKKTSSLFGSHPSLGVPSSAVPPGFGKQPMDSSQQPSSLGTSPEAFNSTSSLGPSPPLGFGRTVFGNPSSAGVTSVFTTSSGVAENKGFTSSNFSFKPVSESLFKPIFGAGPESQSSSMPDSAFGKNESQTSDSTSTNFFSLAGAKSTPVDFKFSQSPLAPSAQSNPLTTGNSSTNPLQFTFSQPLLLSSTNSLTSASQPAAPSLFSFSVQPSKPQTTTVLKGSSFEQSSLFGDTKINADANTDEKGKNLEDTSVFTSFNRGTKRKEGTVVSSTGLEKSTTNEGIPAEGDSLARLTKRPLMRPRGPLGGIFSRAVSDLCRDGNNTARSQMTKGTSQRLAVREEEREQVQASDASTEDLSQHSMDKLQKSEGSGESHVVDMYWLETIKATP